MNYIEKDCAFTHEGRSFEANGAFVGPKHIVAYLGKGGRLEDWHGNRLGHYWITATWKTPKSFVSSKMCQVLAVCDGVKYTGRSVGEGFIYKGRARNIHQ